MLDDFSFESQFRGAIRQRYTHESIDLDHILVVTDLPPQRAEQVVATCRRFLADCRGLANAKWEVISEVTFPRLTDLTERLGSGTHDLVIAYRNLGESPRHPRNSLGTYVDNLTQATRVPVLLLPIREDDDADGTRLDKRLENTDRVLVVTDHLTEDPQLIRWGAELTQPGGRLILSHIEDESVFERYMRIVQKLPEIDDDIARTAIRARLLKEARDFCAEAARTLKALEYGIDVVSVVEMDVPLQGYRKWLHEHEVDLIVADAKDPNRYAMSGLTHALAVEFLTTPILLL